MCIHYHYFMNIFYQMKYYENPTIISEFELNSLFLCLKPGTTMPEPKHTTTPIITITTSTSCTTSIYTPHGFESIPESREEEPESPTATVSEQQRLVWRLPWLFSYGERGTEERETTLGTD